MAQKIATVALVVRDYDEAKTFYVEKLGFSVVEDSYQPEQDKRWLVIAPASASSAQLLLAQATTEEELACVGNQAGGRVLMFLHTDDFQRDYRNFIANGVEFMEEPRQEVYGTVAVFKDLYGNKWDLIQPVGGLQH